MGFIVEWVNSQMGPQVNSKLYISRFKVGFQSLETYCSVYGMLFIHHTYYGITIRIGFLLGLHTQSNIHNVALCPYLGKKVVHNCMSNCMCNDFALCVADTQSTVVPHVVCVVSYNSIMLNVEL